MPHRVMSAIVSRWDDQSLDATFLGGLWAERAPSDTSFPYVVMSSISESPERWTSTSEFKRQLLTLDIWYKEDGSTDPVNSIGTLLETLDAAMSFASLSIPSNSGHVLEMRRTATRIEMDDSEDRVWHGALDYAVRRRKSVSYNPV
jgi:hypothetical protein